MRSVAALHSVALASCRRPALRLLLVPLLVLLLLPILRCTSCCCEVHLDSHAACPLPLRMPQILSTNTRRTKVVELSTGTHRVADELRRHSLTDGCASVAQAALI